MRRNGRTLVAYFVASRSFPFLSRLTPHYPHLTPTSRLTRLRRLPPGGSETGGGKVRGRGRRQQNQGSKIDRRDGFSVFLPSRRPPSLTVCLSGPPFSTLTPVPPSFPFVSPYALSSSCRPHTTGRVLSLYVPVAYRSVSLREKDTSLWRGAGTRRERSGIRR